MIYHTPPKGQAFIAALLAIFTLALVFISEYGFGLLPCHLCYWQRLPWAIIIAAGLVGYALPRLWRFMFWVVLASLVSGAILGLYHAGVEYGFWQGPTSCSASNSSNDAGGSLGNLLARAQSEAIIPCDKPAFTLFGISMAGYNFLWSLICIGVIIQLRRAR